MTEEVAGQLTGPVSYRRRSSAESVQKGSSIAVMFLNHMFHRSIRTTTKIARCDGEAEPQPGASGVAPRVCRLAPRAVYSVERPTRAARKEDIFRRFVFRPLTPSLNTIAPSHVSASRITRNAVS